MSDRIRRSDQREQEYEKYTDALSSNRSRSTADMFGSSRPVSYQERDSSLLPAMTSGLLNLSEIKGESVREEYRPKFRVASELGRDVNDVMIERSMNRRIAAGLPVQDEIIHHIDQEETQDERDSTTEEVFASIDALISAISKKRDGQMNRIAQNTAIDLIRSMGIPEDQKEWFSARIERGVTDPDVFRRDLKMAISSEEVL